MWEQVVKTTASLGRLKRTGSEMMEQLIINSLGDGLYSCDEERCITYWSVAAERLTGWKKETVVGTHCYDNVLNHVDKDGHRLCGKEFCPLHRAIITGEISADPVLVFGMRSDGTRLAMEVTVAPLRDDEGQTIGGVEVFRDASNKVHDLEFASKIQQSCMELDIPDNSPLKVQAHYISRDIVGGDYYAVKEIAPGLYGFMLSDVMGHGISAALYTMHISSLWKQHNALLLEPKIFAQVINAELTKVLNKEGSFTTGVCGVIELETGQIRFSGAGGPPAVLMHEDGSYDLLDSAGFPLGLLHDATFEESSTAFNPGDTLLIFSDGVMEIESAGGEMLGLTGFVELLKSMGLPQRPLKREQLDEALLRYSNKIGLLDDLTIIEIACDPKSERFEERSCQITYCNEEMPVAVH